jgi:hypothetical protein
MIILLILIAIIPNVNVPGEQKSEVLEALNRDISILIRLVLSLMVELEYEGRVISQLSIIAGPLLGGIASKDLIVVAFNK